MKRKTILIILGIVIFLVAIYGFYSYKKKATESIPGEKTVNPDEALIAKEIAWMRKDPSTVALIKEKAAKEHRTFEEQLRADAAWYVEQNKLTGKY